MEEPARSGREHHLPAASAGTALQTDLPAEVKYHPSQVTDIQDKSLLINSSFQKYIDRKIIVFPRFIEKKHHEDQHTGQLAQILD